MRPIWRFIVFSLAGQKSIICGDVLGLIDHGQKDGSNPFSLRKANVPNNEPSQSMHAGVNRLAESNETDPVKLLWSDEFDGSELDENVWNVMLGDGCSYGLCGWGNNELEIYTRDNIKVENGMLIIEARKQELEQNQTVVYTSGRINTDQLVDVGVFGRYEARIKLPRGGKGIWPAFWMLPSDWIYGGWPKSGEIDIMEQIGREPYSVHGTIHFGMKGHEYRGKSVDLPTPFSDDFHVFAVEREYNYIRWLLDDVVYFFMSADDVGNTTWPFNEEFYFLINLAIGGLWPGYPDNSTHFPQHMLIDYVKIYDGLLPSMFGPRVVDFDGEADEKDYRILNAFPNSSFNWTAPEGSCITSGQGTSRVTVQFGDKNGILCCEISTPSGKKVISLNILVKGHFWKQFSFIDFNSKSTAFLISHSGSFSIVQNHEQSNIESASDLVAHYTRASGSQYDTLAYSTSSITDASDYVSFQRAFYMDILTNAPKGTYVMIQLENSLLATNDNFPIGRHSRYSTRIEQKGKWERLRFEYVDSPDQTLSHLSVDRIIIMFSPDSFDNYVFYFNKLDSYEIKKSGETPQEEDNEPTLSPSMADTLSSSPTRKQANFSCPKVNWRDEFDNNYLDEKRWNIATGDGCSEGICGWGNSELQLYEKENISLKNGYLFIEARRYANGSDYEKFTSARINTDKKGNFEATGRVEARIKIPFSTGLWPAFWMLPSTPSRYGGWPESGEIDIMESMSKDPISIHVDIHYGKAHYTSILNHLFSYHPHKGGTIRISQDQVSDDFHKFAVEREKHLVRWLIDDVVYKTVTLADVGEKLWVFDEPFYVILNLAIGGSGPGSPDKSTIFPQSMIIDYVRSYDNPLPALKGPLFVTPYSKHVSYEIINPSSNCSYTWKVPRDAKITAGQDTPRVSINFGRLKGFVECDVSLCSCHEQSRLYKIYIDHSYYDSVKMILSLVVAPIIMLSIAFIWSRRRNSAQILNEEKYDDEGLTLINRKYG